MRIVRAPLKTGMNMVPFFVQIKCHLGKAYEVANKLAGDRYLLQEHVKRIVDAAGQHWDWTMAASASTPSSK